MDARVSAQRTNIVTVLLQDYFHRGVFRQYIGEKQWARFESRLDKNVDETCELLSRYNATATFFALGWIGEQYPALIKRIQDAGHEIASAGYWARSVRELGPVQFRDDLKRSRRALESAGAHHVQGYRCAYKWITDKDRWAFEVLASERFAYDGSYLPKRGRRDGANVAVAHRENTPAGELWELPVATRRVLLSRVPISGGNYLRQLPSGLMHRYFRSWQERTDSPFVLYFHPWELDTEQPVISAVGVRERLLQYRNLGKMRELLPRYLELGKWTSVRDYLDLPTKEPCANRAPAIITTAHGPGDGDQNDAEPVSVVIPCYNEEDALPYLEKALGELSAAARGRYRFQYVFVDDCSKDSTRTDLQARFGGRSDCKLEFHERNKGVAGAIMTGIRAADNAIVCSMDADCSYDPLELLSMIPELDDGVDMVTASPYHPDGFVLGVPGWRLMLSKTLSRMYHLLLRHKFWTYTSCFRVYRRDRVAPIQVDLGDFRGIVELLAKLDMTGGTIKEHPATLQSRIFGYSKMKTIKTIWGHLRLLWRLMRERGKGGDGKADDGTYVTTSL